MSSFQIWCLLQVSKNLPQGQQRAEKARHFEKIQLGEYLATNSVNWHLVCNMISYKRYVLERQSLSEVKMGRGSPICERVHKKIVEYFKNNIPQRQIAKALQISSSTVGLHDISHAIVMRISSVKPALWLEINLHHLFSDGVAFNTQSRSLLTSYAISRSLSHAIHLRFWAWIA